MGEQAIIMQGFFDSVKKVANDVGAATNKQANITKLQTEIMYLQNRIKNQKSEFGITVFDHMRSGEQALVQQFLQQFDAAITQLEQQVQQKQAEIESWKTRGAAPQPANDPPPAYQS